MEETAYKDGLLRISPEKVEKGRLLHSSILN